MLNVAVLMGRLVADPELKHTQNDIPKTTFSLAVDRNVVKKGEEKKADFIDVIAWRGTAEFICKYFKKGQLIAISGSIQTSPYTDTEGNRHKVFEILADNAHFADSKPKETV